MAKKSNINISAIGIIRIIVFLLIGFILFTVYTRCAEFLTRSSIFTVKEVFIDASIQFIDARLLKQLKGRNIFLVDINKLHRQIALQYPQIAQLKIERQLPDRIMVKAKKRVGLLQVHGQGKYLVIDTEGVSLAYVKEPVAFPIVYGVPLERTRVVLGAPVAGRELNTVVRILREFKSRGRLSSLRVTAVEAGNLSKIDLTVGKTAHIILDEDKLVFKIDMLEMLLIQNRLDFNQIKYIDVRFKEPIIAQYNDEEKGKD